MTFNDKIVTVGIPVYNEENFLKETLLSVIGQTYKNLLIVVSDNFSSDNSAKIIEELQVTENRIKLIKQSENIGATENFKFIVDICETQYFMWLGAHDIISETYIEDSVKLLEEKKDAVLVYHKAIFFTDNIENPGSYSYSEIDTSGLGKIGRLNKIFNKTGSCTAIHGVFKTKVAKQIPFVKMIGPDALMLFATASYGNILQIDKVGFFRRETYPGETVKQRRLRYEKFKMFNPGKFSPAINFAFEHIKFTSKIPNFNLFAKFVVILNIVFRFSVNYIIFEIFKRKKKQQI
jgi:glycosyltransferase involved in cell wall biosynthesis